MSMWSTFLVVVLLCLPALRSQQAPQAKSELHDAKDSNPRPITTTADSRTADSTVQKSTLEPAPRQRLQLPPWWDVTWSTWGLVVVGLGGTTAALWTLVTIKRQTAAIEQQVAEMRKTGEQTERMIAENIKQSVAAKDAAIATRDSAEAALLNAKGVINAERAWVFVAIKPTSGADVFNVYIENFGRTPAEIIGITSGNLFPSRVADLPDTPVYGEAAGLHRHIIVPNDAWLWIEIDLSKILQEPGAPTLADVRSGAKKVLHHGVVRYRDVLTGNDHETRFCFFYVTQQRLFHLFGPKEYVKHT